MKFVCWWMTLAIHRYIQRVCPSLTRSTYPFAMLLLSAQMNQAWSIRSYLVAAILPVQNALLWSELFHSFIRYPRRLCRSAWVEYSSSSVCMFVCPEHNSKASEPKVFKLGIGNDFRISYKWHVLGVSELQVRVTVTVRLQRYGVGWKSMTAFSFNKDS